MDTKTMGKNRGERFWLLLSASLAGSGLIFAFVPVFGDVFLMPVLAAGIVSFGVFWLPYVWLENDSVVGRLEELPGNLLFSCEKRGGRGWQGNA
ncbi:hypothetical protein [Sellimonas intestinalis]|uniref:hypothetical protein n=1 Tax=Sellimonas intestinalis TaxID=1653434 RepID=UPI003995E7C2